MTKRKSKRGTTSFRANSNGYIHNEFGYARERQQEVEERDTIIAIGYAERQVQDSLRLAGKVNTEL